jgi:hypothetical protein
MFSSPHCTHRPSPLHCLYSCALRVVLCFNPKGYSHWNFSISTRHQAQKSSLHSIPLQFASTVSLRSTTSATFRSFRLLTFRAFTAGRNSRSDTRASFLGTCPGCDQQLFVSTPGTKAIVSFISLCL